MADFADEAAALTERERAAILTRRAAKPAAPAADGPCRRCSGDIEPRRRATLPHTTLCAACAHDVRSPP